MMLSIPAASSKMRRSDPPAAASIRPTGTSLSRWAGSEIAQPSSVLISVQLRSARRFSLGKGLVVGEIGDFRRRISRGRHHQRVIGRDAIFGPRDEGFSRVEEIDIVGGADAFAAQDANADAGIVNVALALDQKAVPGIAFRSRKAALGVHHADVEKFRHLDPLDQRARPRQSSPARDRTCSRPHRRDRRARSWSAPRAACPSWSAAATAARARRRARHRASRSRRPSAASGP